MKNLDVHKLGMLDEQGRRMFIIPAEVRGFFSKWRTLFHVFLIFVFLAMPWLSWNGEQLIWLNIADRQFHLFGLLLTAQDAPLIFVILISATLGLAFMTAVFGRIWCGWGCPQTVFIESVYRRIERWVEGDYKKRRLMRLGPWTKERRIKFAVKWILYFIVSSLIAHSFAAYFVGARPLIEMIQTTVDLNLNYFLLISGFTGLLLFDFGWFREQFCLIACPYGRIQSVLMDPDSMTVMYDEQRGEPRKGTTRGEQKQGDCVSCLRCVQVCPTGIDIRNGQQMECIGCTACIDACDEIMVKVKKPMGLIRYGNLSGKKISLWRGRPLAYLVTVLVASSVLVLLLTQRSTIDVTLLRGIEAPFQIAKGPNNSEIVINHFRLRVKNQGNQKLKIRIRLESTMSELVMAQPEPSIRAFALETYHFFVKFDRSRLAEVNTEKPKICVSNLNRPDGTDDEIIDLQLIGP